ncbi:MAG: 30S ribosomal protein S8 [Endomicrobium sp.]|jgi:small subunit ribosomal protein S8|nr:30S ribosomal protein S8 [Endomicrobium sp.]
MITDQVSDMLTRIRNANLKFHKKVDIPLSKFKFNIAKILKKEGYILNFENVENNKKYKILRIYLKYSSDNHNMAITGIKRISKPSLRIYRGYKSMPRVVNGLGIAIVSTSNGLMTDKDSRKYKIGGEIIGYVW